MWGVYISKNSQPWISPKSIDAHLTKIRRFCLTLIILVLGTDLLSSTTLTRVPRWNSGTTSLPDTSPIPSPSFDSSPSTTSSETRALAQLLLFFTPQSHSASSTSRRPSTKYEASSFLKPKSCFQIGRSRTISNAKNGDTRRLSSAFVAPNHRDQSYA